MQKLACKRRLKAEQRDKFYCTGADIRWEIALKLLGLAQIKIYSAKRKKKFFYIISRVTVIIQRFLFLHSPIKGKVKRIASLGMPLKVSTSNPCARPWRVPVPNVLRPSSIAVGGLWQILMFESGWRLEYRSSNFHSTTPN